jgi:prepilin-type N-terminal cleavage/methylation domain-containing protein
MMRFVRRAERGYTVVEVMSALTLFAIGAAGVIGMQRVTIQGGVDARNFDVATNIAREWQSRLQRDAALNWTAPNAVTASSDRELRTVWLKNTNIGTGWRVPPTVTPWDGNSATFDMLGRELELSTDPNRVFCVQYRLSWIAPDILTGGGTAPTALLRAEIRVFWSRLEFGPPNCSNTAAQTLPTANQLHFVQIATALRANSQLPPAP